MGLLVTAVRPPTVPEGSARIRLSVTLHQKRPQLAEAAIQLVAACRKLGLRASF
jgi:7-keto-8-aminopelargonate synthetase-like enzyme